MGKNIENIVIVGGGTSGWLSAIGLTRLLKTETGKNCQITLIESSDIGTIGVGEATIHTIRQTFQFLGLDEDEWMRECNASFKTAIKFVNWSNLPNRNFYWHPFKPMPVVERVPGDLAFPLSQYWLKRYLNGNPEAMDYSCYTASHLCDVRKSPKLLTDLPYQGKVEYGYHLDAGLLATYLKGKAKEKGVKQVVDTVLDVVLDDRGYISHLITNNHGELHGDLFIDCSGFRGLLINQTLKEPFISFSDSLFCDSAIAMRIPTDDEKNDINNYTTATALNNGWVWNIPLFGRSGDGYVYSSAFISPEDAEKEFRQHLGCRSDGNETRHLKMRIGRTRNAWVKNCVSIGLSGGFIEPLESTGIFLSEIGLINLLLNFPDQEFNEGVIARYNEVMKQYYEEIRDFIVLHYCTTNREDTPFWKENKYHPAIPETLQEKFELWSGRLPNHDDFFNRVGLFPDHSYACILAGMNRLPKQHLPILDYLDDTKANQVFQGVKTRAESLKDKLPGHYEYLKGIRDPQHSRNLVKQNWKW